MTTINKIGILGGGQLARMLATEGHKLGFEIHVLSEKNDDPAAQVVRHWNQGDLSQQGTLDQFFKKVDQVIIESEFLDSKKLLSAQLQSGTEISPSPQLIGELQDRLTQKAFLKKLNLPTAPHFELLGAVDAERFFNENKKAKGIVLKKRRFGYDGYGTFLIKSRSDLDAWSIEHGLTASDFIAEQRMHFKRELALTMVLDKKGNVLHLPLVEWKARDSKCYWVKGPVRHPKAKSLAAKIAKGLKSAGFVGAVTFELFDTGKDLWVNEIAPRVHNSAHHSLDALNLNQFSLHLLAAAGFSFARFDSPQLRPDTKGFAMLNLIGRSTATPQIPHPIPGRLHWYGKSNNRAGRKMGHVTVLGTSADKALKHALNLEKKFKL